MAMLDQVSFWVATTIASAREVQQRVSLIKRFLVLAEVSAYALRQLIVNRVPGGG